MFAPATPVPAAPVLHPNQIDAMYYQMRNNGQYYIGQLGSHPISIDEWKERELKRGTHQ